MINRVKLWQIPRLAKVDSVELDNLLVQLKQRLENIVANFKMVKFASSLAVEDMVLTDVIARYQLPITIFTLNTNKLHTETVALLDQLKQLYQIKITIYWPNSEETQQFEHQHGKTAMYESIDLRRRCCYIRKIEPLGRALRDADAWLTGQRQDQSITRADLRFEEMDHERGISKFNPIFDWSENDVWAYVLSHDVPINQLYYQGFPSIGCEPCTMPVKEGADIRSGRWWWESQDNKECGLHKQEEK